MASELILTLYHLVDAKKQIEKGKEVYLKIKKLREEFGVNRLFDDKDREEYKRLKSIILFQNQMEKEFTLSGEKEVSPAKYEWFERGCFKSEQRPDGYDWYLRRMGVDCAYDIFQISEYDYNFPFYTVNWDLALEKVIQAQKQFDEYIHSSMVDLDVINFSNKKDALTASSFDAIKTCHEFRNKMKLDCPGECHLLSGVHFTGTPLKVHAILQGKNTTYIVTDRDMDRLYIYKQYLEVIRDTITFVLSQHDPNNDWYLHSNISIDKEF